MSRIAINDLEKTESFIDSLTEEELNLAKGGLTQNQLDDFLNWAFSVFANDNITFAYGHLCDSIDFRLEVWQ
jgi:hypothetical protein